jgi:thioredoxin 1
MNTATKETFADIIRGDKPVLVDFYAEWCGPCKMMKPVLEELRQSLGDQVRILKIDIDRNPALTSSLNIVGVPTIYYSAKSNELTHIRIGGVPSRRLATVILLFIY